MGRFLVLSMFILLLCLLAVRSPRKALMLCITTAAWMGIVVAVMVASGELGQHASALMSSVDTFPAGLRNAA